jgi:hypothetical protein
MAASPDRLRADIHLVGKGAGLCLIVEAQGRRQRLGSCVRLAVQLLRSRQRLAWARIGSSGDAGHVYMLTDTM